METLEAMLARPTNPWELRRVLDSKRTHLNALRDLVGEFAAFDVRPLRIVNGMVERVGELELPTNLRDALQEAATEVAQLEWQLYDMLA